MNELATDQFEDDAQSLPAVSGTDPASNSACCKVSRVADAYQLTGIDNELRRRYESEDATLHDLADYVNNRITAATVDAIGNPINAEPATVRAALHGEESISATKRDDIKAAFAGRVHLDILTGSFVSHETIRRHLNEHLEVSTSKGGFDTFEELRDGLIAYEEQYKDGVRSALKRAGKDGMINGEQFVVFSTRIECEHCSEVYRLQTLLDNDGCDCNS